MSHTPAPGLLTHGHPINPWSRAKLIYALSPSWFMPEHPNSSEKGDEKVVLTGGNRNEAGTPQVETVSPAMLLSS